MKFIEKTLSSQQIYDGRVVSLRRDEIELENGEKSFREVIHNSGGACVLAELDGFIYFVKQYRYAQQKVLLEIPAGKLNEGENPKDCAMRELSEETGLIADDLVLINSICPTPAYTDEIIYIYQAKGLKKGEIHLDNDEFLSVVKIPVQQVKTMLENGEFHDAKTLVALYYYFNNLK